MKTINNLQLTIYKRGFTLIELLVAISIIGILSSFLLANFVGVRQRARDGVRKADLRQIQSALELYRSDKGEYPLTEDFPACGDDLEDSSSTPVVYMKKIPCDPSTLASYSYTGTNTVDTGSSTYSLTACLENENDSQKDADEDLPDPNPCDQSDNFAYTLQNP